MFQDTAPAKISVRRRILLMSIVLISANLALTLSKNSRVYLFEQARCLIYYQINDPTKVDPENGVKESLCKITDIQRPLSILVGVDAMLAILPSKRHTLLAFHLGSQITGLAYTKKLACSTLGPRYIQAALASSRPAKTLVSELVLLSHRRCPFHLCVYVHLSLL